MRNYQKNKKINNENDIKTVVLVIYFVLILGTDSTFCSNDTRTGLPFCNTSCSYVQNCWLVDDDLRCSGVLHTGKLLPSEDIYYGKATHTFDPINESEVLVFHDLDNNTIPQPLLDLYNIKDAYMDADCSHCFNESCNGNLAYCDLMSLTFGGCDITDVCFIEVLPGEHSDLVEIEGEFVPQILVPVCFSILLQSSTPIVLEEIEVFEMNNPTWFGTVTDDHSKKRISNHELDLFFLKWEQPHLVVTTPLPENTFMIFTKTGMNMTVDFVAVKTEIKFDVNWTRSTEDISYRVYVNSTLVGVGDLECHIVYSCNVPDCYFCQELMDSFDCLPAHIKVTYLSVPILLSVILLLLIVIFCVWLYFKCKCTELCCTGYMRTENNITVMPTTAIICLFLLLLISGGLACDASFSIQTMQVDCFESANNTKTCTFNGKSLAEIPTIGMEICYDIYNKDTKMIEGRIIVNYVDSQVVFNTKLEYWTSDWELVTFSRKSCPHNDFCNSTFGCDRTFTNLITMDGAIIGETVLLPGKSGCMASCACAGCGCGWCSSGCEYWRAAMRPRGKRYKVLSVTSIARSHTVRICYVNTDGHPGCNTKLVDNKNPIGIYGGSFQYLGSLSDSTLFLGENNFIMSADGSELYFCPTATASLPDPGGIGDLQAISENNLINVNSQSAIFSNAQFTAVDGGDSAVFNSEDPGINELAFCPAVPFTIGSIRIASKSNSLIIGMDSAPPSLLISISTVNLTLQQTISKICPKMTSINIKGCYQCPGGAMWSIKAFSECLNGACLLSMTGDGSLMTSSIYIGKEPQIQYVNFTAPIKEGSVKLTCESGTNTAEIESSFSLEDPHTVIDPNGTHTNFTPGVPTDGGTTDWDWSLKIGIGVGSSFGVLMVLILILCLVIQCKPKFLRLPKYKQVDDEIEMSNKPLNVAEDEITDLDVNAKAF
jgi:hypothetical protein